MKLKGKQIKDIAFWIECHILILFLASCHTQWDGRGGTFLSRKYQ